MKIFQAPKPISISLSPNTEKDDVRLALKMILRIISPGTEAGFTSHQNLVGGKRGTDAEKLEEEFKKYLGVKYAFAFNSGRSALMAILQASDIQKGDEVLLQAFTCNVAINPILERGARPVFVDVDDTINMDPEDLKKKITHSTGSGQTPKAVIIQHTFGWPARIDKILEITRENNLFLIEDCAHSLGAKYEEQFCGTFGTVSFFSFGRDKIISSVFGGMAVTNDEKIGKRLEKFQRQLDFPSNLWIFQQLLHPILTNYLILPAYGLNQYLGRIILGFFHKISLLSKAVYKKEKEGEIPKYFPKKLPNALAILALNQFRKLERFNNHRRVMAEFYEKEFKNTQFILPLSKEQRDRLPIFMRYPVLIPAPKFGGKIETDRILKEARKRKIYLDDGWRKSPVVPPDTNLEKMNYNLGSCPRAERIAKSIINLPTHINISKNEAKKITGFLKKTISIPHF